MIDMTLYQVETILEGNLYPTFTMNARGQKFAQIYDIEMQKLIKDGAIDLIYQNRGIAPPVLKPER